MSDAPIRLGILSVAHGHAYSYAAALRRMRGVELAGVYDDHPRRGEAAAQRFATTFYAQAGALLDNGLDGVLICAENAQHAPLVHLAAGYTRNILCEKPIATTLADAHAMLARCQETGARLQIAFPVRFSPPIVHLKAMIDRGDLGTVYSAKCTNHGSLPGGWFVDRTLAGGGAVMDHTVHVIDLLRWFWGTEVVEVYAEIGYDLLHPGLGIDDAGLLSFRLANGVYGTLDTSWSRPSSYPTWGDVKIELTGANGVVTVDAFRQHLSVSAESWGKTRWVHWGSDMDAALMADFVEMVRTERPPSITGLDGLKALEVALAAYRSAELAAPVTLDHSQERLP
ncbi:MAG TPA: Gfo/Idh/MocA family oxidoreductase [Caldilineaceae bacterium]|nr:Gfo/Idh/MocA family oxidoreductase [Caldilineaceae bacterium]